MKLNAPIEIDFLECFKIEEMKIDYNNIIGLLKSESEKIIEELRMDSTQECVNKKRNIDNAIKWLKKGMENQIDPDLNIVVIPEKTTKTPSSEFRLMEDQETDDRKYWTEVRLDDKGSRLMSGNFLIMK